MGISFNYYTILHKIQKVKLVTLSVNNNLLLLLLLLLLATAVVVVVVEVVVVVVVVVVLLVVIVHVELNDLYSSPNSVRIFKT